MINISNELLAKYEMLTFEQYKEGNEYFTEQEFYTVFLQQTNSVITEIVEAMVEEFATVEVSEQPTLAELIASTYKTFKILFGFFGKIQTEYKEVLLCRKQVKAELDKIRTE